MKTLKIVGLIFAAVMFAFSLNEKNTAALYIWGFVCVLLIGVYLYLFAKKDKNKARQEIKSANTFTEENRIKKQLDNDQFLGI